MTIQEVSGNPAWTIDYYRRNEAAAYLQFLGIAHIVGVQHSTDVSVQDGWGFYDELFKPVTVPEDPEGVSGPWAVQLTQSVRFAIPDKAALGLPFIVDPNLQFSGLDVDEEMIRPTLHVYMDPDAMPQVHVARTSRLGHYSMERPLQMQARYITWLSLVEAQVYG
jgi:hypothetical protein